MSYKNNTLLKSSYDYRTTHIESIIATFYFQTNAFNIAIVYVAPHALVQEISHFVKSIIANATNKHPIIFTGDFNLDMLQNGS